MNIRNIFFYLYLCLAFPFHGVAQAIWSSGFPFAEQLPSNEMTCLHQDRDGFIWVGTTGGLARYDGYRLQIFQSGSPEGPCLSHSHITCIAEDSLFLWVGTTQGLNCIDKQTYQIAPPEERTLQNAYIRALCSDGRNTVWAATDDRLFAFRLSPAPTDTLLLPLPGQLHSRINSLFYDRKDERLWICTNGGVFTFSPHERWLTPLPAEGQPATPISMFRDREGHYWLTTWGEGLWQIVPGKNWKQVHYMRQEMGHAHREGPDNYFFSLTQDDTFGYLWALSYDRLHAFRYDRASGSLMPVPLPPQVDTGKMYTQFLNDRDGNLWLSSYDGGAVLTFHAETVRNYPLQQVSAELGSRPNLLTLDRDGAGRFWFIQDRFGLCLHDPANGQTVLSSPAALKQTMDVRVAAFSPADNGLWVAAPHTSRLHLITLSGGEFHTVRTLDPSLTSGISATAQQMQATPDGKLWTRHEGRIVCHTPQDTLPLSTPDSLHFTALHADARGNVWGATGRFLYQLKPEGGRLACHRQQSRFPSPETEVARFLYADEEGGFWTATDHGRILHAARGQAQFQDASDRFNTQGKTILNLLGQGHHLWLICHNQIVHYDIATQNLRQCRPADGDMAVSIFREKAAILSAPGTLYAGGFGGVVAIAPPHAGSTPAPPRPAVLTDIRCGTRSLLFNPSPDLTQGVPNRHSVVLRPEATNISVSFSTLDHARSTGVRYAFRLEGLDKTWNYLPEGENTAYYQNLPKGRYRLLVKATDAYGHWQGAAALLAVTRLPAWYETPWAYAAYALLALLLATLLLRLYLGRLRSQNQLKLHEALTQAKLDYFTNISHDLLTPLSVISCVGDYWTQTYPAERQQAGILRHNITRLKHLLAQALDFRKAENGTLELRPSEGSVFAFARQLCSDFFLPLAEQKGVRLRVHIPEGECRGTLDFDKADKILYNLLSNAVKYTPEGKNIDFTVETKPCADGRHVVFTVQDEGPGIPCKEAQKVFERFYTGSNARPGQSNGIGLALSRELAELHHGSLTLESEPGKGARFTLTLPIDLPAAAPPQPAKEEAPGQPESPAGQGAPRTETDATAPDDGTDRPLVLLVDDNTQLLSMMAKVLSPAYRTATATGGEEALALLQREDVDVVVSDVMMPGMDGFALCRRVKSQIETSHIPVIMLTAKQSPDDRVACYEAGADGFLAKPFELKVLAARIDNLIRARHQRQEDFKTEDRVQLADLDYASADTQFLQAMADSIHAHLAEEGFGVEQLATDLNVSKSTLHRKVKAMTGLTPLEFIRNVKLKYACAMLARHDRPIAEVAYATGFSSPKYFTRCFKEEFGLTPSEYQQQHPAGE